MKIGFGTPNMLPGSKVINVKHGEKITFALGVTPNVSNSQSQINAYLWTNHNSGNPKIFKSFNMESVTPNNNHTHAYELSLDCTETGTFTATAYVELNGKKTWQKNEDIIWRISQLCIEDLYIRQIPIDKINARSDSEEISTIEEMLDGNQGSYNIKKISSDGVNCLWIQTPYRTDPLGHLPHIDNAGSDYASTDWFSIDPEICDDAKNVPNWDKDEQMKRANFKMKKLISESHMKGMKIIFGIAPNHVGHNYIFRDLFFKSDNTYEVKRGDYSQITKNSEHLAIVNSRLNDPNLEPYIKDFAEWMCPEMYATLTPDGSYNSNGASNVYETYSPDWYGIWSDTKHLNHGGHAGQKIWHVNSNQIQNWKVLKYIGRAMLWAVIELGVDGFRIDHAYGMPIQFFSQIIPWVEIEAKKYRTNFQSLIIFHEDHDRKEESANWGDKIQSNGYEKVLHSIIDNNPERIWDIYSNKHKAFLELYGTGNHDEIRGSSYFNNDLRSYGNAILTMLFLGGAMTTLAGDEYGESRKLQFKSKGGIPTLWQAHMGELQHPSIELDYWLRKGAKLKKKYQVLMNCNREKIISINHHNEVLAFERYRDIENDIPLQVFSNLKSDSEVWIDFKLGANIRKMVQDQLNLDPDSYYQAKDLFSIYPERSLWNKAKHGHELLNKGYTVGLNPYQIQVILIYKV